MSDPIGIRPESKEWTWHELYQALQIAKKVPRGDPDYERAQRAIARLIKNDLPMAAEREKVTGQMEARDVSKLTAGGMNASDMMSMGMGDEGAGVVAAGASLLPGLGAGDPALRGSVGEVYRRHRDEARDLLEESRTDEPGASLGGSVVGALLGAKGAGAGLKALGRGALKPGALSMTGHMTAAQRGLRGGATGAGFGGVYGAASANPSDDLSVGENLKERANAAAIPSLIFGALGGLGSMATTPLARTAAKGRADLAKAEAEAGRQPYLDQTAKATAERQPLITRGVEARVAADEARVAYFDEIVSVKKEMQSVRHKMALTRDGTQQRILEERLRGLEIRNGKLEAEAPLHQAQMEQRLAREPLTTVQAELRTEALKQQNANRAFEVERRRLGAAAAAEKDATQKKILDERLKALEQQNAVRVAEWESHQTLLSGRVERDPIVTELARLRLLRMQQSMGSAEAQEITATERQLRAKLRQMGMSPGAIDVSVEKAAKLTPQAFAATEAEVASFVPGATRQASERLPFSTAPEGGVQQVAYPGMKPRSVPLDPRYAETVTSELPGAARRPQGGGLIEPTRGVMELPLPDGAVTGQMIVPGIGKPLPQLTKPEFDVFVRQVLRDKNMKDVWRDALLGEVARRAGR